MGKAPARIATKAIAATLLLVVAPQPVDATPGRAPAEIVGLGDCRPSSTELDDISFVAEQEGIPLEEALARYGWQTCFVEVASYFRESYPDEYAGAAIIDDGHGAWIAFKGPVPAEAADLVESMPVSVDLIGGKGFSESELNEALQAAYYPILNHQEVEDASGSYDIETGVITIQVQPRERPEDESARDRLRSLLQPSQHSNPSIHFDVVVAEVGSRNQRDVSGPRPTGTLIGVLGVVAVAALVHFLRRQERQFAEPALDSDHDTLRR